jgi:phosphotransferase system enzyme I (PtsI)
VALWLWVGFCGVLAGVFFLWAVLLGLGVDVVSTGAAFVPRVKRAVQALDIAACLKLVEDVRHDDCAATILAKCTEVARAHYPELL